MKQYQKEITEKIIDALKKGINPWQCPFEKAQLPINYKTLKEYQGINIVSLWLTALFENYTSNYWLGFSQAKSLNGNVKKGSKGTKILVCFNKKELVDGSDDKYIITPFFKVERVFNLDQIEGLKLNIENSNISNPINIETMLNKLKPKIIHKGERAFFDIKNDYINMPYKSKFKNNDGYYSTLFHELIHWTGHKTRLDRFDTADKVYGNSAKKSRAFEELIAEIGSSFLSAYYGIKPDISNTSSYVGSWLKELANDTNYIFKACKQANLALIYLTS